MWETTGGSAVAGDDSLTAALRETKEELGIDLAESRFYSGIAHPDCIKLFGHKPSFALNDYFDRLAAVLAKNNMYIE